MAQQHRIRRINTEVGKDKKITVELNQDFDLMEILSLKFSQTQAYTSFCADYGVVCGRISVNNGLGVPNARVSIFVPLKDKHVDDPVISALYPYTQVNDKNEDGYRYNLLPSRQQHGGHTPTGTFFDQQDILTREEVLEVFETYYSYTVKTNSSGDFMIWGVPLGTQTLHVDVDLSDIGCFSLRPYDFIRQGKGVDNFKNKYKFKSSADLVDLPQIVSFDKSIDVYPFWGNEDFCDVAITRTDFDLATVGVKIQPKAFLIGGAFTDTGKNSINKNCTPNKKMGRKCDLAAKSANIEALRYTPKKDSNNRPIIEYLDIMEDVPDDGAFVVPLEMNMDYLFTNEFGENEITSDPNKGVPTSACYRLRMNMNDSGLDRVRANADFLIPNIREFGTTNQNNDWVIDDRSYAFDTEWSGYPTNAISLMTNFKNDPNNYGYYPQDYFYRFNYNKVYTVSSFHSHFIGTDMLGRAALIAAGVALGGVGGAALASLIPTNTHFANINEAHPPAEEDCGDKLTPPTNFGKKNYTFTLLIADILLVFDFAFKWLTLMFLNVTIFALGSVADFLEDHWVTEDAGHNLQNFLSRIQIQNTTKLSLITYPECNECSSEDQVAGNANTSDLICVVATFQVTGNSIPILEIFNFNSVNDTNCGGTAKSVSSLDYLFANQDNYAVYMNNRPYSLSASSLNTIRPNPSIPDSYVYGDPNGFFKDPDVTYTVTIVDAHSTRTSTYGGTVSNGCDFYDKVYDDNIIHGYYVQATTGVTTPTACGSVNVYQTVVTQPGQPFRKYVKTLSPNDKVLATAIYGSRKNTEFYEMNDVRQINCSQYYWGLPNGNPVSEFRNGVFYVVPGTQSTGRLNSILNEYYVRKRIGKMFCGGIVNYGFVDNWLSGSLYFPQFKIKRLGTAIRELNEGVARYCRNIARLVVGQGRLYYRSSAFNGTSFINGVINRPTTFVDLGPRDEFIKEICVDPSLDPNCSVARSVGQTSYHDLGEILGLAINYRMDVAGSNSNLGMFFENDSFFVSQVLDGDILQLVSSNNEAGIEPFDLENPKYVGYQYNVLDPEEYPNFFKVGNDYGPLPLTLELSEDGYRIRTCLNEGTHKDYHGNLVEGRLTESSQRVPFYLWDKKGTGFGSAANKNNQAWDYSSINVDYLQGMTYGYNITGGTNNDSDPYALLPITNTNTGLTIANLDLTDQVEFETISNANKTSDSDGEYPGYTYLWVTGGTVNGVKALGAHSGDTNASGVLYIRYGSAGNWQTINWDTNFDVILPRRVDYYSGTTKQILSTPFQFYFGLTAGKTGLDKFIDLFGPKGAFPSAE
jgi:hypothetical protein